MEEPIDKCFRLLRKVDYSVLKPEIEQLLAESELENTYSIQLINKLDSNGWTLIELLKFQGKL